MLKFGKRKNLGSVTLMVDRICTPPPSSWNWVKRYTSENLGAAVVVPVASVETSMCPIQKWQAIS